MLNTKTSLPQRLASHFGKVTGSVGGAKALGAVAQFRFESQLGPWQRRLEPATQRAAAAAAKRAAERLLEHIAASDSEFRLHVAWIICSRSVCEALSYDSQLVPPVHLAGVEASLRDDIAKVFQAILGTSLAPLRWRRAQLRSAPRPSRRHWLAAPCCSQFVSLRRVLADFRETSARIVACFGQASFKDP